MSLGRDIRSALLSPYRFAFQRSGAVVMSPQVAFVGAFVVVYLAALTTYGGRLGHDAPIVLAAIALAFGSIVVGITTGWRRWGETAIPADPTPGMPGRYLAIVALAITAVGFAALAVYFVRIGAIPLFMASAEQGRVDAAERGGAPLRGPGAPDAAWGLAGGRSRRQVAPRPGDACGGGAPRRGRGGFGSSRPIGHHRSSRSKSRWSWPCSLPGGCASHGRGRPR